MMRWLVTFLLDCQWSKKYADDTEELCNRLLEVVKIHDGQLGRRDAYSQRYVVDYRLVWRSKQAMIRSAWIIEHDSDTPRLTSCYPL